MNQVCVTKVFKFEAAHKLPGYNGDCCKLHGHSYKLEVTVKGEVNPHSNNPYDCMAFDFNELSRIVKENIIERFDHSYINDLDMSFLTFEDSEEVIPTAENMVIYFSEVLQCKLPKDVKLVKVRLWETETSYATFYCD